MYRDNKIKRAYSHVVVALWSRLRRNHHRWQLFTVIVALDPVVAEKSKHIADGGCVPSAHRNRIDPGNCAHWDAHSPALSPRLPDRPLACFRLLCGVNRAKYEWFTSASAVPDVDCRKCKLVRARVLGATVLSLGRYCLFKPESTSNVVLNRNNIF